MPAADPVPLIGTVTALFVPISTRNCSLIASIISMNEGSRCPKVGRDSAQ